MGIFLQKMMLHLPGIIDAQLVRQLDLIKGFLEQSMLIALVPGPGNLMFVKYAEFHALPPRYRLAQ
jgi:hypothetical protein